jgi:sulfoxide reductase catalytic subunit YedY
MLPGLRHSIGLARWWHLGTDMLWLLNDVLFYVLLFATGQWHRIVPTTWKVFPSAVTVLIQYLSLHWPTESGWVAHNSLQLLAYFITVFVAAPLALITGLGMSLALSTRIKPISRVLSIQVARSLHFLVLCWFLFFIVIHVTLVFTTGLLRNLNHIFAGRNDSSWIGFGIFCLATAIMIVAWVAATPFTLRPERCSGSATRWSGRYSGCSSTWTPPRASTVRRTSRHTSGTTARSPPRANTSSSLTRGSPAGG